MHAVWQDMVSLHAPDPEDLPHPQNHLVGYAKRGTSEEVKVMKFYHAILVTFAVMLGSYLCQAQSPALQFVPIKPCRVADTRNAAAPFGGPAIPGGSSRDFYIPQSPCNVPQYALAYSLNVTAVPVGDLGYLTVSPSGGSLPLVSTLNSYDGGVRANAAIVPAGVNGGVNVFVTDPSQVILDINGYFVASSAEEFFAVPPVVFLTVVILMVLWEGRPYQRSKPGTFRCCRATVEYPPTQKPTP